MRRLLTIAALPLALACAQEDVVTFVFDREQTRDEAALVEVYAIALKTRSGDAVGCAELLDAELTPDDEEAVVVQHTTVELPTAPGQRPLLVQVPQDRYAFHAEAFDRFGFLVASGCAEAEVTSQRRLDLTISMTTAPAPSGTLEAAGPTAWVQHAGGLGEV